MDTGKMIKMLRKNCGLTQEELGELLGVKKSAIQKYENGKIQNIKMDVLRRMCTHLNVPPLVLLFPEYTKYFRTKSEVLDAATVEMCLNLNDEGRKKVKDYIMDLSAIEKYKFKETPENYPLEETKEDLKMSNEKTATKLWQFYDVD